MHSSSTTGPICPMKKLASSLVKMKNGVGSMVNVEQRTQSGQEKNLGSSATFGGYEDYATMIEDGHKPGRGRDEPNHIPQTYNFLQLRSVSIYLCPEQRCIRSLSEVVAQQRITQDQYSNSSAPTLNRPRIFHNISDSFGSLES